MSSDKQRGNTENLKPFKKGQSGNPKGRPPKPKCIPDLLRKIGDEDCKNGNTNLEEMCAKVWSLGVKGERWAVEWLADRMEGKPTQTTLTATADLPIGFELEEI